MSATINHADDQRRDVKGGPAPTGGVENGGLKQMKREIELNQYDVDPGAVADAILRKLELIRRGRQALGWREAGRTRSPRADHHRDV